MKRLTSNVLSIIGGDVARRLLGFFTIAYLARTITTADFGAINIGFTVLSYALMTSSGGLNMFGAREVARGMTGDVVNALVSVKIVAAMFVYIVVSVIVLSFVPSSTLVSLILVFCVSLFVQAALLEWYFQGKEEMRIIGFGRFASALVYLLLTLLLVHSSADLLRIAVAAVAGDVVATVVLLALYGKRNKGLHFQFTIAGWKTFIAQTIPLGAGSILAHFSINLPPIVIGIIMTNADVGIYSAASKMVVVLLMFDRVLGTLLLPASARLYTQSPEALSERLNTALRWILVVALPFCVGAALLADRLIPFVFGAQYQSAAVVLQVLVWYMLFTMVHTVYSSGIVAVGKEKEYGRVMLTSAIVYGISIVICTKLFGIIGASAAVVGSEALTLVLMRRAFHQSMKTVVPRSLPRILLAVILMAVVLFIVPPMHIIFVVLIGAGVYAAILFVTRAVTAADVLSLVRRA